MSSYAAAESNSYFTNDSDDIWRRWKNYADAVLAGCCVQPLNSCNVPKAVTKRDLCTNQPEL